MAGIEPKQLKEEIRSRINLADLIGNYVRLRKSGRRYIGLCPFHAEDTPSFSVNPEEGFYYCFGCKAAGDVFSFVMQMEGISFPEALERLATRVGIALPQKAAAGGDPRLRNILYEVNRAAEAFFTHQLFLPQNQAARDYLLRRGISEETARHYRLGYAPNSWDALTRYLLGYGKAAEGHLAGLLLKREDGSFFDLFRHRIVFPILDGGGHPVAFGGRALDELQPKYINSPETPLFNKSRQLFGVPQAREGIRRSGRIILVEGYFDCLALHQAGIHYVTATCGTAMTAAHMRQMRNLAADIYICYDADAAGKKGVVAGLSRLAETFNTQSVKIVELPPGDDPDSYIRREGAAAFYGRLEKALPFRDFQLEEALRGVDVHSVSDRLAAIEALKPVIAGVKSPVERDIYLQRLAARLQVPYTSLAEELAPGKRGFADGRHTNSKNRDTSREFMPQEQLAGPARIAERELLRCLIRDPSGVAAVYAELGEAPFSLEAYNVVFRWLMTEGNKEAFYEHLAELSAGGVLEELLSKDDWQLTWQDCLRKLRLIKRREELTELENALAALVESDPVYFMQQWCYSLLAYRRWRKMVKQDLMNQPQAC